MKERTVLKNNIGLRRSRGISVKLMILVTAVTVGVIGTTTAFVVQREGRYLMEEVMRGAALFSDAIQSSIYHFMLEDRRGEAYRIMNTVGQQGGVETVRIFNKEGTITFSTQGREIGTAVDKRAESCYACHAAGQPIVRLASRSRSRIYTFNGHRVLGMVTPIYNESACSTASCHAHPASQSVLGVLDVSMSLADIDRGVALLQRATIVLSALAVVALAFVVNLVVRRLVVRPVTELVDVTHNIAAGDFTHMVHVDYTGELGILAQSFNTMTESLRAARENLEERTAALRETQQQLIHSEKMASLGKLAASIAHEINNPLAGILTTAKLLIRDLKEGPPDEAAQASFRTLLPLVERETLRCTVIVRNLLDFSRQRDLKLAATDLNAVLEEALSLLNHHISLQNITVENSLESSLPPVEGDFGQLRQAFLNVLMNASEAMPNGGTIRVASRVLADRMVEIECADTGVGIPSEHLAKLEEPFFTTKERGTGLGLSVVYGVVERHHGKLQFRSEVNKGTTVTMRFPSISVPAETEHPWEHEASLVGS
jgi:two-component system NtrC family sensor kinase